MINDLKLMVAYKCQTHTKHSKHKPISQNTHQFAETQTKITKDISKFPKCICPKFQAYLFCVAAKSHHAFVNHLCVLWQFIGTTTLSAQNVAQKLLLPHLKHSNQQLYPVKVHQVDKKLQPR